MYATWQISRLLAKASQEIQAWRVLLQVLAENARPLFVAQVKALAQAASVLWYSIVGEQGGHRPGRWFVNRSSRNEVDSRDAEDNPPFLRTVRKHVSLQTGARDIAVQIPAKSVITAVVWHAIMVETVLGLPHYGGCVLARGDEDGCFSVATGDPGVTDCTISMILFAIAEVAPSPIWTPFNFYDRMAVPVDRGDLLLKWVNLLGIQGFIEVDIEFFQTGTEFSL